jgi:hypothetical protein
VLKRAIDAYNDTVHSHLHGRTPDDLPEDDVLRFRLQAEASNDQGKNEVIIKRREAPCSASEPSVTSSSPRST